MASPVAPVPPVVPVLYDDEWYVVVDKPSGLCVHDSPEVSSDDTDFVIDRAAGIVLCLFYYKNRNTLCQDNLVL